MPSAPSAALPLRRLLLPGLLALAVSACGGGDADLEATPDDVDADAPATVTEEEIAAFTAPEDGVVSEAQVEAYLKTSLLQFDLLRQETEKMRGDMEQIQQRGEDGGMLNALRNAAAVGRVGMQAVDLIGGSYVRSSRSLGYNPAEMEWVREQVRGAGVHLAAQPLREMAEQGAAGMREQAEQLRAQAEAGTLQGFTEEDVQRLLESADQAERSAAEQAQADPEVAANLEVMRRARPNVTDEMWTLLAAWGSAEWAGLYGLGANEDPEVDRRLGELRVLYEAALENRTVDDPAAALESGG